MERLKSQLLAVWRPRRRGGEPGGEQGLVCSSPSEYTALQETETSSKPSDAPGTSLLRAVAPPTYGVLDRLEELERGFGEMRAWAVRTTAEQEAQVREATVTLKGRFLPEDGTGQPIRDVSPPKRPTGRARSWSRNADFRTANVAMSGRSSPPRRGRSPDRGRGGAAMP